LKRGMIERAFLARWSAV